MRVGPLDVHPTRSALGGVIGIALGYTAAKLLRLKTLSTLATTIPLAVVTTLVAGVRRATGNTSTTNTAQDTQAATSLPLTPANLLTHEELIAFGEQQTLQDLNSRITTMDEGDLGDAVIVTLPNDNNSTSNITCRQIARTIRHYLANEGEDFAVLVGPNGRLIANLAASSPEVLAWAAHMLDRLETLARGTSEDPNRELNQLFGELSYAEPALHFEPAARIRGDSVAPATGEHVVVERLARSSLTLISVGPTVSIRSVIDKIEQHGV